MPRPDDTLGENHEPISLWSEFDPSLKLVLTLTIPLARRKQATKHDYALVQVPLQQRSSLSKWPWQLLEEGLVGRSDAVEVVVVRRNIVSTEVLRRTSGFVRRRQR